jgi:hypothetical protein
VREPNFNARTMQSSTILARTPAALLSHLSRLPKAYTDSTLLFTLSTNVEPQDLSTLVSRLTSLAPHSVGCLSAPQRLPGSSTDDLITCSLAAFGQKTCKTFRSTIPGRPAAQVGRWHSFRNKDDVDVTPGGTFDECVDWQEVWDRSTSGLVLPVELQSFK